MLVATALSLAAASTALGAGSGTSLRIAVRATPTAPVLITTLRCNPAGGTVPRPADACRRLLAAGRAIFAPTPRDSICTEIYGGPQEALVTGTLRGAKIWARFRRRDGCDIARWNRVAFLLGNS